MFFIFNRYDKRFLFKDQTSSIYDVRGGGKEGGGREGYLGGFLKGKEGRISCRRQNMKGNYRKLAANSLPIRML